MQAFQHRPHKNEFFFFPGGYFAGGNAAAPVQNELEQIVVEPLAYLVLHRFHVGSAGGEAQVLLKRVEPAG